LGAQKSQVKLHPNLTSLIEISAKSGKDSTSTLSLVINRVRFKKNLPPNSTLAFKGWKAGNSGNHQWFPEFHPLSFVLSASTDVTYIFTAPTCTVTKIPLEPCPLNAAFHT
jgi:hypothetical protein